MTKDAFLGELARRLAPLPEPERARTLAFYDEAVGDRVDAGRSEEDAVAELGSVAEIADKLLDESDVTVPAPTAQQDAAPEPTAGGEAAAPLAEAVPEPSTGGESDAGTQTPPPPKRGRLPAWAIVLLVVGSPVWFSIGISVGASVFSVLVSLIAVLFSFYMTALALVLGGLAALVCSFMAFANGPANGLIAVGGGLACVGAGILLGIGTVELTLLSIRGVRAIFRAIRRGRERRRAR